MTDPSPVTVEENQNPEPPASQDSGLPDVSFTVNRTNIKSPRFGKLGLIIPNLFAQPSEMLPLLDSMPTENDESLVRGISEWWDYLSDSDSGNQEYQRSGVFTANPNESQAQSYTEYGFNTIVNTTNTNCINTISVSYTRTISAPSKPTRGKFVKARNPRPKKEPAKRNWAAPAKPSISQLRREAAKRERLANRPPKKPRKTKQAAKASSDTNPGQNPDPADPSQPSTSAATKPPKRTYTKRANNANISKFDFNTEATVEANRPTEAVGPFEVSPVIPTIPIDPNIPTPTVRSIGKTIKPRAPRRKKAPVIPPEGSDETVPPEPKTKAPPKPRAPRKPRQTKASLKKQQEEEALRLLMPPPAPMEPIPTGMPMEPIPIGVPMESIPRPIENSATKELMESKTVSPIRIRMSVAGQYISPEQRTPQSWEKVQNSPIKPFAANNRATPRVPSRGKTMKNLMSVLNKKTPPRFPSDSPDYLDFPELSHPMADTVVSVEDYFVALHLFLKALNIIKF